MFVGRTVLCVCFLCLAIRSPLPHPLAHVLTNLILFTTVLLNLNSGQDIRALQYALRFYRTALVHDTRLHPALQVLHVLRESALETGYQARRPLYGALHGTHAYVVHP